MADKDDDASSSSQSMSSGLSDSWSMVNNDGDIDDDDSCSTTSSVEVVDEDGTDQDQQSQLTSLSTSPGMGTPKGPMFVLRLSSHDVSDTDDDQPSTAVTENITNSESFDILSDQKQVKKENLDNPIPQDRKSSPKLEEHVESLVKAISDVKTNYESGATGPQISLDQNQISLSQESQESGDDKKSSQEGTTPESDTEATKCSSSGEKVVETVGRKSWVDSVDDDELTTSDFSLINNEPDPSASRDSPDTSDSTIMNQSMGRTEDTGDQLLSDDVQTGEPADENEAEDQYDTGNKRSFVERLVQWYNIISDLISAWRDGLSRDSIIAYMCVVMAVMFLASTFTAYTVLLKKDKATKHVERYQFVLDNYNYAQRELEKCRQTKNQLEFDLANSDVTCEVPLQKIVKLLRGWKYASPEHRQSIVDELSQEAQNSCGVDNRNCHPGQDNTANKISEIAYLLKLNFNENLELERTLQGSNSEISKLKASLEETKWKLAKTEMKVEKQKMDGMDDGQSQDKNTKQFQDQKNDDGETQETEYKSKHQFSNNKEDISEGFEGKKDNFDYQEGKSEEEVSFNQCLNVMVEYYKRKLNEKPKFEWFDYGSGVMREYLFGYLHDIIPENLQAFMRRLNSREATLNEQNNQDQSTDTTQDETVNGKSTYDRQWEDTWSSGRSFGHRTKDENDENDNDNDSNDETDHYDDETQDSSSDDSDFTNSSAGRWTDSILDMMNKTRTQLQETWDQVKNVSEKIWIKHEPAITRLQKTFTRKLQNLSTKFQEKLVKKARKWFNKSKKSSTKDRESGQKREEFARTKRRKENSDTPKEGTDIGYCKQFLQMKDLLARRMNLHKFRRSELSPNLISRMKKLKRDDEIPKSSAIRNWLDCQLDWWSNNENYPTEMPQYVVTNRCFDWLECWQIEISEGDRGIGRRKCERLKKGNKMNKPLTECEDLRSNVGADYDDDDFDDDNTDDDLSDEEIENWFLRRAEMRDYHHTEPDDWYFRRYNKWQQEKTGKRAFKDCDL